MAGGGVALRPDMDKVIVERPRVGSRQHGTPKGYRRKLQRSGLDGLPRREGIKRRSGGKKWLNEHLAPLRRFLDGQVGRPWDKVYSEICAHIDRNSAVQDHVRDHVDGYVCRRVEEVDGVVCLADGSHAHGSPLAEVRWVRWYVCPRTGLLRRNPAAVRRRVPPAPPAPARFVWMGDDAQCRKIDGAWHLVALRPLPPPWVYSDARDVLLDCPVADLTEGKARATYGAPVYAVSCRRLARRELSQTPVPRDEWV